MFPQTRLKQQSLRLTIRWDNKKKINNNLVVCKMNSNLKVRNIMKYIALLRGINVSGKNKIAMSELKTEFGKDL